MSISLIGIVIVCLGVVLGLGVLAVLAIWMQTGQIDPATSGEPDGSSSWERNNISPARLEQQIQDLVSQNQKIEAIKVYREAIGSGLKEAQDAVEAIERGGSGVISSEPQPVQADLERRVKDLLLERRKIEAVKVYREATGTGLKDAKDAVDAIERELQKRG